MDDHLTRLEKRERYWERIRTYNLVVAVVLGTVLVVMFMLV